MSIATRDTSAGLQLPVLGLGTWQMGGRELPDPATDETRVIAAIHRALEGGITHIDTAEAYASGYTEALLGQALRNYERSKLVVASKWSPWMGNDPVKSCEASLDRLGLEYLDLYMVHRNPTDLSLDQTMEAMDSLVERNLVRYLGVCNFSSARQAEAQELSANRLVCNQVHYNLIYREPEIDGLVDWNIDNGSVVSAWRPMQYGDLSDSTPALMQEMCSQYNATPAQIAIAWLTSQPGVITLVQTMNAAHLEDNIAASRIELSLSDVQRLRNEYPDTHPVSNSIPLDT